MHYASFTPDTRHTAGILLLAVLAIEYGGTYVLRLVRGSAPATPFQLRFARAGHAHAGILVVLALVTLPYADVARLSGGWELIARSGVWLAAILMPAGFFLASAGRAVQRPNRFVVLVYAGAVVLAAAVTTLGVGLLRS
ncbi:hypothetical protein OG799_14335 [Micromonospora sp. NBC_00898]|uniref:hypothetical protein n=1 Tax=Micromonospora sp. NBC_00898 TaxID=2975981 RepID=UPI003865F8B6|nr:hypothetical protein OG799_14335 [Micromonospora sp. NBC_00898]